MNVLVAEDDTITRKRLQHFIKCIVRYDLYCIHELLAMSIKPYKILLY